MPKRIPTETIDKACEMAKNGHGLVEISKELSVSRSGIKSHILERGIEIQRYTSRGREYRHLTDEIRQTVCRMYADDRIGPTEIVRRLELPGVHTVYSCLRQRGILRRNLGGGPGNAAKPGTTRVTREGYVVVKVSLDWPWLGQMSGYGDGTWIPQHRAVMAEHLGRALMKGEQVHHKDGDRTNNSITNLQLRTSAHGSGVSFQCRGCGSRDIEAIDL
jgi:biotin operon repressor